MAASSAPSPCGCANSRRSSRRWPTCPQPSSYYRTTRLTFPKEIHTQADGLPPQNPRALMAYNKKRQRKKVTVVEPFTYLKTLSDHETLRTGTAFVDAMNARINFALFKENADNPANRLATTYDWHIGTRRHLARQRTRQQISRVLGGISIQHGKTCNVRVLFARQARVLDPKLGGP